jgi:hypothetical protein
MNNKNQLGIEYKKFGQLLLDKFLQDKELGDPLKHWGMNTLLDKEFE